MNTIKISARDRSVCVVDIEGTIGAADPLASEGSVATYGRFRERLNELKAIDAAAVEVNIRSTGGDVNDALMIHDALSSLKGTVTTRCHGYTASAATIIAQAASEGCREISSSALYLVHDSSCMAEGNASELGAQVDLLRQTDARLAELYAARSGRTVEEIRLLMGANNGSGRWLSPEEALEAGLVDRVVETGGRLRRGVEAFVKRMLGVPPPSAEADHNVLHLGPEEHAEFVRRSELVLYEGQRLVFPTRTDPCEDPSVVGDSIQTSNDAAYAEDARRFLK